MSFLSKAWKAVRGVVAPAIGSAIGGPAGGVIGSLLAGGSKVPSMVAPVVSATPPASPNWGAFGGAMPGGSTLQPAMAVLPGAGRALMPLTGAAAGGLGRAVGYAAGRATRAAMNYCKRNPQWCASIGGMAAVEAMVRSGQLPAPKRRRGRGISATELRAFKRVAKFTSKYCAPVRRAMSAPALRKGR